MWVVFPSSSVHLWVYQRRKPAQGHLPIMLQEFLRSVQENCKFYHVEKLLCFSHHRLDVWPWGWGSFSEQEKNQTLFVSQWEPQHQDVSCEQFQLWKRENDPEYQRQGLAGYLRDNGISKTQTELKTTSFISVVSSLSGQPRTPQTGSVFV